MFFFEAADNLMMPGREAELAKLRKPPYTTVAGLDEFRRKANAVLVLFKIMGVLLILMGIPATLLVFGFILIWLGAYLWHLVKKLKAEIDTVYDIRRTEILNAEQHEQQPMRVIDDKIAALEAKLKQAKAAARENQENQDAMRERAMRGAANHRARYEADRKAKRDAQEVERSDQ